MEPSPQVQLHDCSCLGWQDTGVVHRTVVGGTPRVYSMSLQTDCTETPLTLSLFGKLCPSWSWPPGVMESPRLPGTFNPVVSLFGKAKPSPCLVPIDHQGALEPVTPPFAVPGGTLIISHGHQASLPSLPGWTGSASRVLGADPSGSTLAFVGELGHCFLLFLMARTF